MTHFEKWRTCSFEEYSAGRENPIDPADMTKDTPYLWMVSFDGGYGQQPGQIRSLRTLKDGGYQLGFVTFDGSWHTDQERALDGISDDLGLQSGSFFGGLFEMQRDKKSGMYFPMPGSSLQTRVEEGYFKEDPNPPSSGPESGEPNPDDGIARTPQEMRELIGDIGETVHV